MNARRPPTESKRNLRLVSDEGRTVADPPQPVPERSPASQPPRHPSMPRHEQPPSDERDRHGQIDEEAEEAVGARTGSHGESAATALAPDSGLNAGAHSGVAALHDGPTAHAQAGPAELGRAFHHHDLYAAIEAVLMVATEPVPPEVLASVTALGTAAVEAMCDDLAREYAAAERGFMLVRVAGGYQMQSAAAAAEYVEHFVGGRRSPRLSAAAMETLAVVAYKQPVSRAQISAIRGVNADGVVRTLMDQDYIAEVDRDPGPGNASLLGTTPKFLERLGLDGLDDLPSLAELSVDAEAVAEFDRLAAERSG